MKKLLLAMLGMAVLTGVQLTHASAAEPFEDFEGSQASSNAELYKNFSEGLHKYLAGYEHNSSVPVTSQMKASASSYDTTHLVDQIKAYLEKAKENPFLRSIIEKIEAIFHKIVGDPQAFLQDPQGFISTHYSDSY